MASQFDGISSGSVPVELSLPPTHVRWTSDCRALFRRSVLDVFNKTPKHSDMMSVNAEWTIPNIWKYPIRSRQSRGRPEYRPPFSGTVLHSRYPSNVSRHLGSPSKNPTPQPTRYRQKTLLDESAYGFNRVVKKKEPGSVIRRLRPPVRGCPARGRTATASVGYVSPRTTTTPLQLPFLHVIGIGRSPG